MKITEVRTRVVEWKGPTVPPQPHFCTNPMDLLALPSDSMASFRFHGWLIVEVFTDGGLVGIGNAARYCTRQKINATAPMKSTMRAGPRGVLAPVFA